MSIEVGLVVSRKNHALWWHEPHNATFALLPDSDRLWNVIWQHRQNVLGFAHSHPGTGIPMPSDIDLSTFAAVEAGLGRRLLWYICTEDQFSLTRWSMCAEEYETYQLHNYRTSWLDELRLRSYSTEGGTNARVRAS